MASGSSTTTSTATASCCELFSLQQEAEQAKAAATQLLKTNKKDVAGVMALLAKPMARLTASMTNESSSGSSSSSSSGSSSSGSSFSKNKGFDCGKHSDAVASLQCELLVLRARCLLEAKDDLAAAQRDVDAARALKPEDWRVLFTCGLVAYQRGLLQAAGKDFAEAKVRARESEHSTIDKWIAKCQPASAAAASASAASASAASASSASVAASAAAAGESDEQEDGAEGSDEDA